MRRFVLLVLLVALFVAAAPALYAQENPSGAAYSERGPYTVGVYDFVIPRDRPLNATVWYPAQSPRDPLTPTATLHWGEYNIISNAYHEAEPFSDHGPYPLVIFSHGHNAFRLNNTYLTEHLASYGFVVIAIDHPGNTMGSGESSGDFATAYAQRPIDLLAALEYAANDLNAPGSRLAGIVDANRTAVIGHSFGGYTALAAAGARLNFAAFQGWCARPTEIRFAPRAAAPLTAGGVVPALATTACFFGDIGQHIASARGLGERPAGLWPPTTDPRIRAVVALAPWDMPMFGPDGLSSLTVPLLVQVGAADIVAPAGRDAYAAYLYTGSTQKALAVFQGAGHRVFDDGWMDTWNPFEAQGLINHLTVAFLRYTLLGDAAAGALLSPHAVDFDRLEYVSTIPGQ